MSCDRSNETRAERVMAQTYGYTRRPGQSRDMLEVPAATLQEIHASMLNGDGRSLLERILTKAQVIE